MSRTATEVGRPAWRNGWGLDVDDRVNPSEYVVLRASDTARRAPDEDVQVCLRFTYVISSTAVLTRLTQQAGIPRGTARWLLAALDAKLASSKGVLGPAMPWRRA